MSYIEIYKVFFYVHTIARNQWPSIRENRRHFYFRCRRNVRTHHGEATEKVSVFEPHRVTFEILATL
jgi:hypothetical protein